MSEPGGKHGGSPGPDHRWLVLVTVAIAQLMVVLDATVVNIALPSAQRDLGFANSDRQWVVTAYALAFGGLLLLGGRVGDLFSRKRVFIVGLLGFAGASAFRCGHIVRVAGRRPRAAGRVWRDLDPGCPRHASDHLHRSSRAAAGARRVQLGVAPAAAWASYWVES